MVTMDVAEEIKRLQKEHSELGNANGVLRAGSVFIAKELGTIWKHDPDSHVDPATIR